MPAIGRAGCGLLSQSVEQGRQRTGLAAVRQQFLGAFAGAGGTGAQRKAKAKKALALVSAAVEEAFE